MKKRLLAAAVAATITLTAGVVMASPLQFDGDVSLHYRWDDNDVHGSKEAGISTFHLNATAALDKNVDLYARIAGQALSADQYGEDFNKDHYGSSVFAFDRFGFVLKGNNSNVTIGRQGASIGATALLYNSEPKVGNYAGTFDGVKANVKAGVTDLSLLGGKVDFNDSIVGGSTERNIYAIHAGYNPTNKLNLGATYAVNDPDGADKTNHWAVDASYGLGKATVFGEYTQSDADELDTAFVFGTSYAFDAKNSFAVMYSKVENNGDMGSMTDFDPNGKGLYYSYTHKLSKDTTWNVFYKDMETVTAGDDPAGTGYSSFRTTVTYKF